VGNFDKVSLGTGALEYDGVDVGFLKGNVEWNYEYDVKKFKTGVPRKLQGQIVAELSSSLKAGYAELSAENVALALGGLSITTTTDTPVSVPFGGTPEESVGVFTFAADANGVQMIQLAPGIPIASVSSITIKSADEVTTYASSKYLVFPNTGKIYKITTGSGDIPDGATVHVAYTYTPIAGKRINLGTQFSLPTAPVTFTHTRPNTGKDVIIHIPKAAISGTVKLVFDEENFIVNDITLDAVEDASNPTYPFGYYFEEA
jgi:hypothetical protein